MATYTKKVATSQNSYCTVTVLQLGVDYTTMILLQNITNKIMALKYSHCIVQ
jgi:hypothetical protein